MTEEQEEKKEAARLAALRQVVWDQWRDDTDDFARIHDVLVDTLFAEAEEGPTDEQVKSLFLMLPAHIIGLGISWGFDDTEVGDGVYRFVEDNEEEVREALGLPEDD